MTIGRLCFSECRPVSPLGKYLLFTSRASVNNGKLFVRKVHKNYWRNYYFFEFLNFPFWAFLRNQGISLQFKCCLHGGISLQPYLHPPALFSLYFQGNAPKLPVAEHHKHPPLFVCLIIILSPVPGQTNASTLVPCPLHFTFWWQFLLYLFDLGIQRVFNILYVLAGRRCCIK